MSVSRSSASWNTARAGGGARRIGHLVALLWILPWLSAASTLAAPTATHRVTHTGDSGPGSLRQAILDANASAGADRIEFGMHLCDPACVIQPAIALPPLTGGGITIDGFSQAGAAPPTAGSRAVIRIALDGSRVENQNGLSLISASNRIQGLAVYGFGWNGIAIAGPEAAYNTVWGNHIGLDADGLGLASRRANGFDGVFIGLGARENTVGGDLLTERNVISGNTWDGIGVHGPETAFNYIQGNFIGLDASGEAALPNALDGIRLYGGAGPLRVGVVDAVGQRNIISGNTRDGLRMTGADTHSLLMDGNLVGTSRDGFAAIPNGGDGLHVMDGARNVSLGTASSPSLGLISGNMGHGLHFEGSGGGVVIQRHFIGVDASGGVAMPNEDGLRAVDTRNLSLGGREIGQGNLISGNRGAGVRLAGSGTTNCSLEGSRIGVDPTGEHAIGNGGGGVLIEDGASEIRVGGGSADGRAGNVISANARSGVEIDGADSSLIRVQGNLIGSTADGLAPLGNADAGVYIRGGAAGNQVGGFGEGEGNRIVANGLGISLQGAGTGSLIYANRIGVGDDSIDRGLGNLGAGIRIETGTRDARIQGNTVAWNGAEGLLIQGEPTLGNWLRQNSIHDNGGPGIRVTSGAQRRIQPPVLSFYDPSRLRLGGRGCPGCEVEIYSDAEDEGAEPLMLGTVAGTGDFGLTLSEAPAYAFFTAIVTDHDAGSSAFSAPLPALASTPTPSQTPSATASPTATASPSPTATATASASLTPSLTPSPTPSASATVTASASATSSATSAPSLTPSATATPTPTSTSSATPTRRPTLEPSPTRSEARPTPEAERIWLPCLFYGDMPM